MTKKETNQELLQILDTKDPSRVSLWNGQKARTELNYRDTDKRDANRQIRVTQMGKSRNLKVFLLPIVSIMFAVGWIFYFFGGKENPKKAPESYDENKNNAQELNIVCFLPNSDPHLENSSRHH